MLRTKKANTKKCAMCHRIWASAKSVQQ